jgi:hypothetical protein
MELLVWLVVALFLFGVIGGVLLTKWLYLLLLVALVLYVVRRI